MDGVKRRCSDDNDEYDIDGDREEEDGDEEYGKEEDGVAYGL